MNNIKKIFFILIIINICSFSLISYINASSIKKKLKLKNLGYIVIQKDTKLFLETNSKKIASKALLSGKTKTYYNYSRKRYIIPYSDLENKVKFAAIKKLFPNDYIKKKFWYHKVTYRGENLYRIAFWFTGTGKNYRYFKKSGKKSILKMGEWVTIPVSLLIKAFSSIVSTHRNGDLQGKNLLIFRTDKKGVYAIYSLKKGEALYSAVVMRFTGRVLAQEVNALALKIAIRSGISDVTNIPVNYKIKIPVKYLIPEFLPASDPKHISYLRNRHSSEKYSRKVSVKNLDGVRIIIDPGHGGRDPGAQGYYHIIEDELVYDLSCRIRRILLKNTKANVCFTNYDPITRYKSQNVTRFSFDSREKLLTTPPYRCGDTSISANLRWYLANSCFRHWLKRKHKSEDVVFISIHADALHPSATGTMLYIPAAELCPAHYQKKGAFYKKFKEVKEHPKVTFSKAMRFRSEAFSRNLAKSILFSLRKSHISIHSRKPIREHVYRKNHVWVPAVLKYNSVPAKILIETANLKNKKDCRRMSNPNFRETFAESVVNGIINYFK